VSDAQNLPGPLAGLRILELADETGQFCGKLLGDLGADVVKIEPPGGEPNRLVGPFLDDIPHPKRSLSFWYYNTSKRGITLSLEPADGRRLFGSLAATSDVILETFRPGFLASLGLDYESLRAQKSPADHVRPDPLWPDGPLAGLRLQ
jgi:crotonobetainyl-CoA:carnitine CoA-transferase CaiB-like acyl-CoA transferase